MIQSITASAGASSWPNLNILACPQCHRPLSLADSQTLFCSHDLFEFQRDETNIWNFLLPERRKHLMKFAQDYSAIRHQEGRYSQNPNFYRSLPFKDTTKKFSSDWSIRKKSFQRLLKDVIRPLLKNRPEPLIIIDAGAGNGWLSYQLSLMGCQMIACDINNDSLDGLGALHNYAPEMPILKILADFKNWPLASQSVDLVIFNASFHYCEDALKTLRKAFSFLKKNGLVVILDTPIYHDPQSGKLMVQEKKQSFLQRFNTSAANGSNIEFLIYDEFKQWEKELNIRWQFIKPFYGVSWHSRPLLAWLKNNREPAKFHLWVGQRP